MALDYTLLLAAADPAALVPALAPLARGAPTPGRRADLHHVELDAVHATVYRPDPRVAAFYGDEYGVRPVASVGLRLDKFALDRAHATLARACAALLAATPGDAALLFNGEAVVLRRAAGVVHLDPAFTVATHIRALGAFELGPDLG